MKCSDVNISKTGFRAHTYHLSSRVTFYCFHSCF